MKLFIDFSLLKQCRANAYHMEGEGMMMMTCLLFSTDFIVRA